MMQNLPLGALALAALFLVSPASADAIDGHWCHAASGKHLIIDGPVITTPGGNQITGDYEQPTGKAVTMNVLDDENMQLTGGFAGASVQDWRRCPPATS
jgi:hypothetical protein